MIEPKDGLTLYERITSRDPGEFHHCECGLCKRCKARGAAMIAQLHLHAFMEDKLPNIAVRVAGALLSPGSNDLSGLVDLLKRDFDDTTVERMLQAAAEFRKCESIEEASAVMKEFSRPVAA